MQIVPMRDLKDTVKIEALCSEENGPVFVQLGRAGGRPSPRTPPHAGISLVGTRFVYSLG